MPRMPLQRPTLTEPGLDHDHAEAEAAGVAPTPTGRTPEELNALLDRLERENPGAVNPINPGPPQGHGGLVGAPDDPAIWGRPIRTGPGGEPQPAPEPELFDEPAGCRYLDAFLTIRRECQAAMAPASTLWGRVLTHCREHIPGGPPDRPEQVSLRAWNHAHTGTGDWIGLATWRRIFAAYGIRVGIGLEMETRTIFLTTATTAGERTIAREYPAFLTIPAAWGPLRPEVPTAEPTRVWANWEEFEAAGQAAAGQPTQAPGIERVAQDTFAEAVQEAGPAQTAREAFAAFTRRLQEFQAPAQAAAAAAGFPEDVVFAYDPAPLPVVDAAPDGPGETIP